MDILIKTVRVAGFRGLQNLEVELEETTVLTGMNNSGKTSLLKALQIALGNRQFLSPDDFYIGKHQSQHNKIIIDTLIVPKDQNGKINEAFSEKWEILFTTDRIRADQLGASIVPLRTTVIFDPIKANFKTQQFILQSWPEFNSASNGFWYESGDGKNIAFPFFDEVPFFYIDAQRDILEDIKLKNSYLGKMLAKIEYSDLAVKEIEDQIKALNDTAVNSSDVLSTIKTTLKELDTAMDSSSDGVDITPFTKKLRDLSKGLSIYYSDQQNSFSMEYHGMGTRSWSSLLTLKSFITLLSMNASKNSDAAFFPILAIEEPEAHLHPNAQKKLYGQIASIPGQKIISTHSPYIAAGAKLNQIRNFYKSDMVNCGKISTEQLTNEDIRKINRQVINTRGEIFFSKLLVFFEGETEEQALPIFFEKHFGKSSVELGVDFVGVGGFKAYLPFLRFAENLKIPWLILSDAEPDAKKWVKRHLKKLEKSKFEKDIVVFLDDGNDFEKQLIDSGFTNEVKNAIMSLKICSNKRHEKAQKPKDQVEVASYDDQKIYEIITGNKTMFGPLVAEEIVASGKPLPLKIIHLFKKIASLLNNTETRS
ncbi:MAG: AAA family ATPase [Methylovulum miyakonense]|uniref:AAA family ATPase n=1 Tax=Methylovulum miyakonense TaxID=645578 RepID=UPI003BB5E289